MASVCLSMWAQLMTLFQKPLSRSTPRVTGVKSASAVTLSLLFLVGLPIDGRISKNLKRIKNAGRKKEYWHWIGVLLDLITLDVHVFCFQGCLTHMHS